MFSDDKLDSYDPFHLTSESALQKSGRLPSHTYLDLRSARHAYLRTRSHPSKQSRGANRCRRCAAISSSERRRARRNDIHHEMQRSVSANDVWMDKWLNEEYTYMSDIMQSRTFWC